MDDDRRSGVLFGRYNALPVYATVAELTKPEFSTGQIARLSGVAGADVSKELGRLCDLGLVERVTRRGDYRRLEADYFWPFVAGLARAWGETSFRSRSARQ